MSTAEREKTVTPKQLFEQQPDPLASRPEDVESYVAAIQARCAGARDSKERGRLRREALSQIELAGVRTATRRDEALDALNRLFRLGAPPSAPLDGFYRGIVVAPVLHRWIDPVLRASFNIYMPWVGKRFNAAHAGGDNLLEPSARLLARLIWPGYHKLVPTDEGRLTGFRFRTYPGPGRVDPDIETLALDYNLDENPRLVVRNVVDELVEVVPGAYLGKMLLRTGKSWRLAAYFAVTDAP